MTNMTDKNFYLTSQGLEKLKKEYEALRTIRSNWLEEGAPPSLESEEMNPEFLSFYEDLNSLEQRLDELEEILKNAQLIESLPVVNKKKIGLGATIEVEAKGRKASKRRFVIVGTLEADPAHGKISDESPMGKALLGHTVNDEVTISWPTRLTYKIKNIKYNEI